MKLPIFAALVVTLVSCTNGTRDSTDSTYSASSQSGDSARSNGSTRATEVQVYVDVRTPEEFAAGHVVGAINIPHDQMAARLGELIAYRNAPIVAYCASGRRSGIALDILTRNGFTQVANGGGFEDLRESGVASE